MGGAKEDAPELSAFWAETGREASGGGQFKRGRTVPTETPKLTFDRARSLRKRMSPVEALIWQRLRNRSLSGLKFRRQHPVGPYVLDFCCVEARLVVEIDGSTHATDAQESRDAARTAWLEQRGLKLMRFWARDVYADLNAVLESIGTAAQERITARSGPPLASAAPPPVSPQRGES